VNLACALAHLLTGGHAIQFRLSFVFDNEWPPVIHDFGRREKEMAAGIGTYWTNLARFGDPSGGGSPVSWPQYTEADKQYLELDIPFRVSSTLKDQTCNFWITRDSKFSDPTADPNGTSRAH
jgi:carboxylesterase type B